MVKESYIAKLSKRLFALEQAMSEPAVAADHKKLRAAASEHGRLKKVIAKADTFFKLKRDLQEHLELINDPAADVDLKQLAEDEVAEIQERLPLAEREVMADLLPPEPNDSRNAIMEIRAGTGGEEAALFAGDLFRMYSHFAESCGWKSGILDASASSIGGYKEVVFSVEGNDAYGALKYESGGHRVQRVPVTEAQGRIHTSAATVAVFPEADEEDDININPEELRVDIFCSSGPGGQSVNTTYSAVRITHLPTGLVAQSQDERSQHRNKARAMKVLKARILDLRRSEEAERVAGERRSLIGSGDRSQRIRTYNFPQNRLTDHRINLTLYSLDRIIEGELREVIDALRTHDVKLKVGEMAGENGEMMSDE